MLKLTPQAYSPEPYLKTVTERRGHCEDPEEVSPQEVSCVSPVSAFLMLSTQCI